MKNARLFLFLISALFLLLAFTSVNPVSANTGNLTLTDNGGPTGTGLFNAGIITFNGTVYYDSQLPASLSVSSGDTYAYNWHDNITPGLILFGHINYRYVFVNSSLDYTTGVFPFLTFNSILYPISGTLTIPSAGFAWTFSALYELQYNVTLAHTGPGSITPTDGWNWYTVGNYSLTAAPQTGYGVVWITTGGCYVTSNTTTTTLIVNGSGTVTADFIDITPPVISNLSPSNGTATSSENVTISTTYSDNQAINASSVILTVDGNAVTGAQITATGITYTTTLQPGSHTAQLTVKDVAGNPTTVSWSFTVPQPSSIPWMYIIAGVVAVVAVVAILFFLLRRRKPAVAAPKPPKAASVQIVPDQKEVFADGRSSLDMTIQLLDEKGAPIATDTDREVILSATDGRLPGSVVIPKGSSSVKTTLTSSIKVGAVTISATLKELSGAQTAVNFVEKKRYCMICGQRIPIDAKVCPSCNNAPPSGADTKACKNCGAVIPIVAKFCRDCGASQPT